MKRQRKVMWWLIGGGICIVLSGFMFWPTPYGKVTGKLHAGMTSREVVRTFGSEDWQGEDPLIYKEEGVKDLLAVYLDNPGHTVSSWFILKGPCQKGYAEYTVEKSRGFAPDGGTAGISALSLIIYTVDLSGEHLAGFGHCR